MDASNCAQSSSKKRGNDRDSYFLTDTLEKLHLCTTYHQCPREGFESCPHVFQMQVLHGRIRCQDAVCHSVCSLFAPLKQKTIPYSAMIDSSYSSIDKPKAKRWNDVNGASPRRRTLKIHDFDAEKYLRMELFSHYSNSC